MNIRRGLGIGIAVTAALGLAGIWHGSAAAAPRNGGAPAFTPAQLLGTLHRVDQMEIEAGMMAQRQGRTEAMKRYGATLEHDHATADEHLKQYASAHDIDLSTAPPVAVGGQLDQARYEVDNLQNVGGASFDRQFAQLMVQDHQKVIEMVDHARKQVKDPQLEAVLGELEPHLREHKQIAQNLLAEQNASASTTAPSAHKTSD